MFGKISQVTFTIQSDCFISDQSSYTMLKFVYDIGSLIWMLSKFVSKDKRLNVRMLMNLENKFFIYYASIAWQRSLPIDNVKQQIGPWSKTIAPYFL